MKHIKTFENYSSINEEGLVGDFSKKAKKFFTGHEDAKSKTEAKKKFDKALKEIESEVKKNQDSYSFNKKDLQVKAAKDNYLGTLRTQKGKRDKRVFVVYDSKGTTWKKIASGAANARNQNIQ